MQANKTHLAKRAKADLFRQETTAAIRALSTNYALKATWAANQRGCLEDELFLPQPGVDLTPDERLEVRSLADKEAVPLRFHDKGLHARGAPLDPMLRGLYDALERARYEAAAITRFKGVGDNLEKLFIEEGLEKGFATAKTQTDVSKADALFLKARELLSSRPTPAVLQPALDLWRDSFADANLKAELAKLKDMLYNQAAFQHALGALLDALDDRPAKEEEDTSHHADKNEQDLGEHEEQSPDTREGDKSEQQDTKLEMDKESELRDSDVATDYKEYLSEDLDSASGEEIAHENAKPPEYIPPTHNQQDVKNYTVYTTRHDEILEATDLCDLQELGRLREILDKQMEHLSGVVSKIANRLQRRLMAKQQRSWQFNLEEGLLDTSRLTRVITNPTAPLSFKIESETEFRDTVVTLLIDNSGSMRGRPIQTAAICADILARTLERCSVKVEILGFTTKMWKGGYSREDWIEAGKPKNPGRLNDLRHIIYKSADAPWRRARKNLALMLREGILKENIDGEALAWAHGRLKARHEQRKILMVISDGAPVDETTLSANNPAFLERHLREQIALLENRSDIELVAIGIGHDVTRYYSRAVTITDPEQLGSTITTQLLDLFEEGKNRKSSV